MNFKIGSKVQYKNDRESQIVKASRPEWMRGVVVVEDLVETGDSDGTVYLAFMNHESSSAANVPLWENAAHMEVVKAPRKKKAAKPAPEEDVPMVTMFEEEPKE